MAISDFAIEADGLTKYFGTRKAVDNLTLRVPSGSVYAFLGRNGSGKTTTIQMLLGFLRPTIGTSRVLGHDSRSFPSEARGRIGYVAEKHPLHEWMTVAQEAWFASSLHATWDTKLFDSIVSDFRMSRRDAVRKLSPGQRAAVSVAVAVASHPDLLILDDPAMGLDPVARKTLLEKTFRSVRDAGKTVLFSSHQLDDVHRVADYVAVLDYSSLRVEGSLEELTESVTRYRLSFPPGAMPSSLPGGDGVLSSQRVGDVLILLARHSDPGTQSRFRASLTALGPTDVDEQPVTFDEAMMAYLGDGGMQQRSVETHVATAGGVL